MKTNPDPPAYLLGSEPDAVLTRRVRRALAHLYDYAYLQNHPLALMLDGEQSLDKVTRAQKLRRLLLECLETLRPQGPEEESPSEAMRAHAILTYRYVDGLPISEIASRLALSRRQAYREHEKGVEAVASVLADHLRQETRGGTLGEPLVEDASADRLTVARAEVARLRQTVHTESILPLEVLQGVIDLLAPLREQMHTSIEIQSDPPWPPIIASRVMFRQTLVNILSHALGGAVCGKLQIALSRRQDDVVIRINGPRRAVQPHTPPPEESPGSVGLAVSQALTEAQGGRLEVVSTGEEWQALLTLPASSRKTVLVIDDNADMVALLERYLAGRPISVVGVTEPEQALSLATEMEPQLITLDVMMPGQDGWEILQKLRATPATKDIPIVICSVLNEPRLAEAVGASDYITKPVHQDDLLAVLRRWLGAPSAA